MSVATFCSVMAFCYTDARMHASPTINLTTDIITTQLNLIG